MYPSVDHLLFPETGGQVAAGATKPVSEEDEDRDLTGFDELGPEEQGTTVHAQPAHHADATSRVRAAMRMWSDPLVFMLCRSAPTCGQPYGS